MHFIDLALFVVYIVGLLGFGYYFYKRNKGGDDYYVGGRKMSSYHIGISVVVTDVGGGFSIGLGGLGFTMGIAGSWMLFTGLVGAWMAAAFLIPKVKQNPFLDKAYTFPQLFEHYYSPNVALVAAIISAIGAMALLLAVAMENVLTLMLDSYSFMISGLFVPVIGALFWQKSTPAGAMSAMIVGGTTTLILRYLEIGLPFDFDPNVFGITASAAAFVVVSLYTTKSSN